TTAAREAVLARIRAALGDRPAAAAIPRDYETAMPPSIDLPARFMDRVHDYRATIERATLDRLPQVIAATFASHGARRIETAAGIPQGWLENADVELVSDDPALSHVELDGLDGTIT